MENEANKKVNSKKVPFYIGFTPRLIINGVLLLVFSFLTVFLLYKAFTVNEIVNIRYKEKSNVEYQNNEERMKIAFNYKYQAMKKSSILFHYKITGDLYIVEKDNPEKVFFTENYKYFDETEAIVNKLENKNNPEIEINIGEYNEIVKNYINSYDVETKSYLEVNLIVNYGSTANNPYYLNDSSKVQMIIPLLSEEAIKIDNLDEEKRVNIKPSIHLQSPGLLGIGVLLGIGAVLALSRFIILMFSIMEEKSLYDKQLEKILKKHKKQLQEVSKVPIKAKKRTHTMSMKELMTISKKKKQPVKYCIINEHSKSQFFIEQEDEFYTFVLKEVDLEKKD